MGDRLWSEKSCSSLISALPLWIIEHAWTQRMTGVLEVLGPPPWLEGDWVQLSLEDPCSIRAVAAECWMVVRVRDIKHFERVMSFMDVTYSLLPHLVTPIKHMKIMFGLKTLVIMWMLWDNQDMTCTADKIMKFFPDSLPYYHRRGHRYKQLMQKTQQDFRTFAQSLARNPDLRKNYIRDLMGEQYGEPYAMKLEERLLHYLEELEKAIPQPTCIDQVLKHSSQLRGRVLLQELLTSNSMSMPTALKRLLRCAMTTHYNNAETCEKKNENYAGPDLRPLCVAFRPSQEKTEEGKFSQDCSHGLWLSKNKSPSLLQEESQKKMYSDGHVTPTKLKRGASSVFYEAERDPRVLDEQDPHTKEAGLVAEPKEAEENSPEHLCSRHGKRMKTMLLECSDDLKGQDRDVPLTQAECTSPSSHTPVSHSTPEKSLKNSMSNLQDSSSTNISLSSQTESSSTNISVTEVPLQPNAPVQQMNATSACAAQSPVLTQTPLFQLTTPSPVSSTHLSHSPSSSSGSSFPVYQLAQPPASTAHQTSPSPTESSSHRLESASPMLLFRQISLPTSLGQQLCSSSSASSSSAPLTAFTQCTSAVQVPGTRGQLLREGVLSKSEGAKLRLSSETQDYILFCKWLQPQVVLCRLSPQECAAATVPNANTRKPPEMEEAEEEREEDESFDVNLLYSGSTSGTDTQDYDPDYIP